MQTTGQNRPILRSYNARTKPNYQNEQGATGLYRSHPIHTNTRGQPIASMAGMEKGATRQ
jgi:hypothetical protein